MKKILPCLLLCLMLACTTAAKYRETVKNRDAAVAKTGLYCGSFQGDSLEEDEVSLNLKMSEKCDPSRPFSIMSYDVHEPKGVMFCCSVVPKKAPLPFPASSSSPLMNSRFLPHAHSSFPQAKPIPSVSPLPAPSPTGLRRETG